MMIDTVTSSYVRKYFECHNFYVAIISAVDNRNGERWSVIGCIVLFTGSTLSGWLQCA